MFLWIISLWISSQNEKYTKWLRKSHWIGYLKLVVSYICHCFRSHILWNLELKKKKLKLEKWREKWYEIQKSHNHSHREQVDKNVYDMSSEIVFNSLTVLHSHGLRCLKCKHLYSVKMEIGTFILNGILSLHNQHQKP